MQDLQKVGGASRAGKPVPAPAPPVKKGRGGRDRTVRDLMTEKVFTLKSRDTLETLYDLMDSRRVRHVPILDNERELVGLVTDRDLSRTALGAVEELPLSVERDILRRRRIRDIMVTEPDTIEADAPLSEAAAMLLENKVGCLPVVEGLHLVGIITEADFVRDFVERG
ncbi:MAG TPA: CBS domain-containing protein [Thermoanaerobaculia bacterium]|jgi:CBS domain-containing protein|nr:CBS domain-containing protein [Thermoanaerobaculia bacterium]